MGKKKIARLPMKPDELGAKIDRIIAIRPTANEYRLLCTEVKEDLLARQSDVFISFSKNRAVINRNKKYEWVVSKLRKVLGAGVFEMLCPAKPDGKRLNQRLAAMPEDKDLADCRVEAEGEEVELEVLAHGEASTTEKREAKKSPRKMEEA